MGLVGQRGVYVVPWITMMVSVAVDGGGEGCMWVVVYRWCGWYV